MSTITFKKTSLFRFIVSVVLVAFIGLLPAQPSYAQVSIVMPAPGQMIHITRHFEPPQMVGLKINLKDPFNFDFIMDRGETPMSDSVEKEEFNKIIKYFLVALTMPNSDMWVNLSPYESKRIIPKVFGQTEMGRDLLAQDYILKQFTASLIYPESGLGKKFWSEVYQQAQARFGTTNISVNTFNKVWIVADKADIYQKGDTAFLVDSHLKVMLEQDYMAIDKNKEQFGNISTIPDTSKDAKTQMALAIVREIIIPAIEKEVNEGKSFAAVRQVYNAEIMATWFKKTPKQSLLGQVFANRSRIAGQKLSDPQAMEKIYKQYLRAYKKGVFNYIKEDAIPDGQTIPRKYFSGGMKQVVEEQINTSPFKARVAVFLGNMRNNMHRFALATVLLTVFASHTAFAHLTDAQVLGGRAVAAAGKVDVAAVAEAREGTGESVDIKFLKAQETFKAAKERLGEAQGHDMDGILKGQFQNLTGRISDFQVGIYKVNDRLERIKDQAKRIDYLKAKRKADEDERRSYVDAMGISLWGQGFPFNFDELTGLFIRVKTRKQMKKNLANIETLLDESNRQIEASERVLQTLEVIAHEEIDQLGISILHFQSEVDELLAKIPDAPPAAPTSTPTPPSAAATTGAVDMLNASLLDAERDLDAQKELNRRMEVKIDATGRQMFKNNYKAGYKANIRNLDIEKNLELERMSLKRRQEALESESKNMNFVKNLGAFFSSARSASDIRQDQKNVEKALEDVNTAIAWKESKYKIRDLEKRIRDLNDLILAATDAFSSPRDRAATAVAHHEADLGGINLSDENLTMNIKVDGMGMPLAAQYQDRAMMNLNGLTSIIRSIKPVTTQNVPALLGIIK